MSELKYSQNFLRDSTLVDNLIKKFNIQRNDIVLDIGAGKGAITEQLSKYSDNIIAIELDSKLFNNLVDKYKEKKEIEIVNCDFLEYKLPNENFKTFSNIPFSQTASIIKKLTEDINFVDGCLVMQKEAVYKYTGENIDYPNTVLSIFLGVKFDVSIFYSFLKSDFTPTPAFNIILTRFKRKTIPMVSEIDYPIFQDFVTYIFNRATPNISKLSIFSFKQLQRFKKDTGLDQNSKPSEITIKQYVYLFDFLKRIFPANLEKVKGEYQKNKELDKKIIKINRTRKDPSWRL